MIALPDAAREIKRRRRRPASPELSSKVSLPAMISLRAISVREDAGWLRRADDGRSQAGARAWKRR